MRYRWLSMLFVFACVSSYADDYPFGRLFTAEGERKQLDRLREQGPKIKQPVAPVKPEIKTQEVDELATSVQFSGYVQRSDGQTVLWVDGKSNLSGTESEAQAGQLNTDTREATFKSEDKVQQLKPGQTWLIESNTVAEAYEPKPVTPIDPNVNAEHSPAADPTLAN